MSGASKTREAVTIRMPVELLGRAREVKGEGESLNDLVVGAVDREVRRRAGLQVYEEIRHLRDEIYAAHGLHPSSVPLIRALREGIGRRE